MHSNKKFVLVVFIAALLFSYGASVLLHSNDETTQEHALVTKVIDGDTVIVEGGNTVRLRGIDADESNHPCYTEAKRWLEKKILGERVVLKGDGSGKYDRMLRYLFVNGTNINVEMVRQGLAVARIEGSRYREEIIAAEQHAIENGAGCKWQGGGWKQDSRSLPSICEADRFIGEQTTLQGVVRDAHRSKDALYLNFGRDYPHQCFTAVAWDETVEQLPGETAEFYPGKTVRVRGKVQRYNGTPEIVLRSAAQLQLVQ